MKDIPRDNVSGIPHVMIVDDEESIRSCALKLLRHEGLGAVSAAGADECLDLLREGFRGVILLDVRMPGRDGWDTIREMQEAGVLAGNIICMLTANDPDERMEGLQEVVVDYIQKPYDSTELVAAVRRYLGYLGYCTGPGDQ